MFKPVKQHNGCVSGVIGDSMLALWVTARSEQNLKDNACLAAVNIHKELQRFQQKASDAVKLKTRIGLHYGRISLGSVGALDHYEYTPMGDIVNTASRIEGLNKYLGTSVLVSGEAKHQANGFLTRELGAFRLKGKKKPIVIHELLDRLEEADAKQGAACAIFGEGLNAYKRRSWDEAIEKFHESMQVLGEDRPSLIYLEMCEQYKKNPPKEPWDGVVHMEKK
jgi:adenylate cyclase